MYKARAAENVQKRRALKAEVSEDTKFLRVKRFSSPEVQATQDVIIKQMSGGGWTLTTSGLSMQAITQLMALDGAQVPWGPSENWCLMI